MGRRTFSIGGIHPHDSKISRNCPIEKLPVPPVVYLSLSQHIGAPAKPIVAPGDKVLVGQVIAEPGGFVSAFIHSSVSGTVKSVGPKPDLAGRMQTMVEIVSEGDEWAEGIDLSDDIVRDIPTDPKAIIEKIRLGGVVGLGGATFPTHIKLSPPPGSKCEMLIINGCECEPYLTSDFRVMMEKGEQALIGAAISSRALGDVPVTIAIEENKPEAIDHILELLVDLVKENPLFERICVMPLKKRYPQGSEKQLIDAVMHRQVGSGALPISVGAVVQNVGTALAVYDAVQKGRPLVDNIVSITGECFPRQANLQVRVGTPFRYILDYLGGMPEDTAKLISGGPMMGKAVSNLETSTLKGTSALLMLTRSQTKRKDPGNCIRCGRCANACPMGLEPFLLNRLAKVNDLETLEKNAVQDCLECGCCLYSCPASIPLLDNIRLAKASVLGIIRARAAAAKAAK